MTILGVHDVSIGMPFSFAIFFNPADINAGTPLPVSIFWRSASASGVRASGSTYPSFVMSLSKSARASFAKRSPSAFTASETIAGFSPVNFANILWNIPGLEFCTGT